MLHAYSLWEASVHYLPSLLLSLWITWTSLHISNFFVACTFLGRLQHFQLLLHSGLNGVWFVVSCLRSDARRLIREEILGERGWRLEGGGSFDFFVQIWIVAIMPTLRVYIVIISLSMLIYTSSSVCFVEISQCDTSLSLTCIWEHSPGLDDTHFLTRMTEMWVCVLIGVGAFQLARLLVGLSGMATTSVMHFVLATISVISVKGFHFGRAYGTFFSIHVLKSRWHQKVGRCVSTFLYFLIQSG